MADSAVTLTVQRGPNSGRRFTLSKPTTVLGRQSNCDVKLTSQQVSARHAQITAESGQYVIRDLASDYGTTVNGIPVRGPYPLRDGDVIGLGDVQVGFSTGATDQTTSFWYTPSGFTEQPDATEAGLSAEPAAGGRPRWPMFLGGGCLVALVLVCCVALVVFVALGPVQSMAAAPEVKVYQPATGQQVQAGQPLMIVANARDPKGVTYCELYVNGVLADTFKSPEPKGQPLWKIERSWVAVGAGPQNIELKAYNTSGKVSEPAAFSVMVTAAATPTALAMAPAAAPAQPAPPKVAKPTVPKPAAPAPTATPKPAADCNNNDATYVADVTVPDNTQMQPNAGFNKTWRIRNSGQCNWGNGYKLMFVSGNRMGAPASKAVAATAAGGDTDITIPMKAPGQPGTHRAVWQMADAKGQTFGGTFTVVVVVPGAAPAPAPAQPTPVPQPVSPVPGAPAPGGGEPISLTADKMQLNAGECTTVHARASGVQAAYLNNEGIAGGAMDKQACGGTWTLKVIMPDGSEQSKQLTLTGGTGATGGDGPDLQVRDIEPTSDDDDRPRRGESSKITTRIKNDGNQDADTKFQVTLVIHYRPCDDMDCDEEEESWTQDVDGLDADKDTTLTFNPGFKFTYDQTYQIEILLDRTNRVAESNETNNTKAEGMKPRDPD